MQETGTQLREELRVAVVCGFPRSGTSLMMQMLFAAGVRCLGKWPAFEDDATSVLRQEVDKGTVESMMGGAMKVLDPHLVRLPEGFLYDFLWMRRDRKQQAKSSLKFLASIGMAVNSSKANLASFAESLREDAPRCERILRSHAGHSWMDVRFEDLIDRPNLTVGILAERLCLPYAPMRACIVPRGSPCLPGMLEIAQLASAK